MQNATRQSKEERCISTLRKGALPSPRRIADIQHHLLEWFIKSGRHYPWRRPSASKYQRIIAELLLQRTKADVVAQMYPEFVATYPSWNSLSLASERELEEQLRPLGLWKRRSVSIKALAVVLTRLRGRYPKDRASLEELPGIGQYVCNAILMFDQGLCAPLLDVNMARVLERLFGPRKLVDIRYDPFLQNLAWKMVRKRPGLAVWTCALACPTISL